MKALAAQGGIALLFLSSYLPNLSLIERFRQFLKRHSRYGRYPPTFDFRVAIEETIDGLSTVHADPRATLMTLNFQQFEEVSLLAA